MLSLKYNWQYADWLDRSGLRFTNSRHGPEQQISRDETAGAALELHSIVQDYPEPMLDFDQAVNALHTACQLVQRAGELWVSIASIGYDRTRS